jgi:hypothetical protein
VTGRGAETLDLLQTITLANPGDASLAKECLKVFIELNGAPERILLICDSLTRELQNKPMFRFCRAYALAHAGRPEEAENIITCDGGLEIPDIREGENSISDLYIYIRQEKARKQGIHLSANRVEVPFVLDLRMK